MNKITTFNLLNQDLEKEPKTVKISTYIFHQRISRWMNILRVKI